MIDNYLQRIEEILPPVKKITVRGELDYYGLSKLIASKLGLKYIPRSTAGWKHGWVFSDLNYIEQLTNAAKMSNYLVATQKESHFLKKYNISSEAVGMPFIYLDDIISESIPRIHNSLLIMPPHSLPYTNHKFDEEQYVQQISKLKNDFEVIIVCIHQSCIEKGLWVNTFKRYNIPFIIGADATDENSLVRMYKIFKCFEYMTTNTIGSHVVYSAFCGCKVSIYGTYLEYSKEDYAEDMLYKSLPFLLEYNLKNASLNVIKTKYPFLFSTPKDASLNTKWATIELGLSNKKTYRELKKLLGWSPRDQILMYTKLIINKLRKNILLPKSDK